MEEKDHHYFPLTFSNITLDNMDVDDLKPVSCKYDKEEKIMSLDFEERVIS